MTAYEFDRVLAAFSYILEQAIAEPPAYFDVDRLEELRDEIEEIRLLALQKEASAQMSTPDLDNEMLHWISLLGRHLPSDG